MKRVDLRMEENNKYEVIKKLVETNGNKLTAAVKFYHLNIFIRRHCFKPLNYFV